MPEIRGTIRRGGTGVEGLRILAVGDIQAGVARDQPPCARGHPDVFLAGRATTDTSGNFRIAVDPGNGSASACVRDATVQVSVLEGATLLWRSSRRQLEPVLRIDHELDPDSRSGSVVRVLTELGDRAAGAGVYVNGKLAGTTDQEGELFVPDIGIGVRLAARMRLLENETERDGHDADSTRNWNYRVYLTSVTLRHDANGDEPTFEEFIVSNDYVVQTLVLRRQNSLIGFNIRVSVEWEATAAELAFYRDRFLELSELLFNATDGQFLIERLVLADKGDYWDAADFRVFATWKRTNNASVGGLAGKAGRVQLSTTGAQFPGTMLHELGHYGFHLRDEYAEGDCPSGNQFVVCTPKSSIPGTPFSTGAGKDSCLMRGARYGSRKKVCSDHPDNPHADCTEQGPVACWSVITERYDGDPEWRVWTPVSRRAIVDRLADTGVPLGTGSSAPVTADPVGSYIPIADWKPTWQIRRYPRAGECPSLVARVVVANGPIVSPVNGAQVGLRTAEGRYLDQGPAQEHSFDDGTKTGTGEVILRGAHLGDTVEATLMTPLGVHTGSASVQTCDGPLVVRLPAVVAPIRIVSLPVGLEGIRVDLETSVALAHATASVLMEDERAPVVRDLEDGERPDVRSLFIPGGDDPANIELLFTLFDVEGSRVVLRHELATCRVGDEDAVIRSSDDEVLLTIPATALGKSVRLVIEPVTDATLRLLPEGDRFLVAPHRIESSDADSLRGPAILRLVSGESRPASDSKGYVRSVELLEYVEAEGWRVLPATVHDDPKSATAHIRRLGTYALVERHGPVSA